MPTCANHPNREARFETLAEDGSSMPLCAGCAVYARADGKRVYVLGSLPAEPIRPQHRRRRTGLA
jgi:hypothetical protein